MAPVEQAVDEPPGGNPEAARYRRRLRYTEAQRDALSARVERFQRSEVERLAAEHLANGADLFMFTELASVLDDDGEVDRDKVNQAAREAVAERPGLRQAAPSFDGGVRSSPPAAATAWSAVLPGRSARS